MFNKTLLKSIAYIVVVCYLAVWNASSLMAAEVETPATLQLLAQSKERSLIIEEPGSGPEKAAPSEKSSGMSAEERKALEDVYQRKIERLQTEIDKARGVRNNLLSLAVASFSIGASIAFAVSQVNSAIDDIPVPNPADDPGSCDDATTACTQYVSYTEEKRDAQDSLDGIKGIGGAIFVVGALSTLGYFLYGRSMHSKQQDIDAIRAGSAGMYETTGLTPEYLQQNEAVAAVLDEIDTLKQQIGSTRTRQAIVSRLALAGLGSGAFLFGVSNISHTVVGNITIDETSPEDVAAKKDALDKTDQIKTVGIALFGIGAAAGAASYFFGRQAKGKENQINDLENSLLRVAERIEIRPKADGFVVMYRHEF